VARPPSFADKSTQNCRRSCGESIRHPRRVRSFGPEHVSVGLRKQTAPCLRSVTSKWLMIREPFCALFAQPVRPQFYELLTMCLGGDRGSITGRQSHEHHPS
jgi:hypothetical protein